VAVETVVWKDDEVNAEGSTSAVDRNEPTTEEQIRVALVLLTALWINIVGTNMLLGGLCTAADCLLNAILIRVLASWCVVVALWMLCCVAAAVVVSLCHIT
jgi:antibiotic biosynthesis monooxygenase (ABM) superfamily enzyme